MTHILNKEAIKEYYGTILQGSNDLQTSACSCTDEGLTPSVKAALADVNDEVVKRFYGCGSPIPPLLEGCTVLDLGCGTGRDVFAAAKLAGESGRVIGIDMTDGQLEIARRNTELQMKRFKFEKPNVEFRQGYMEDLKGAGIAENSIDVVMSNCVINLSPDKESVFSEIFRVLKPGGELIFSDVFSGRRVPMHLQADPVLHGECLAGALYREDFRRLMTKLGCPDHRILTSRTLELGSRKIEEKIGMVDFYSVTVRAFKLPGLEDICEDYGQTATYSGGITDWPHYFDLDDHHRFITGKPMLVCGNTASMIEETRYGKHFDIMGDRSVHYGAFDCTPASAPDTGVQGSSACC